MAFPLYKVSAKIHYAGVALIAAESAEVANEFIRQFQEVDNENVCNSWGYDTVTEDDKLDYAFGTLQGIIDYGIFYTG